METPKAEWREIEGGDLVANVEGIDMSVTYDSNIDRWLWFLGWESDTLAYVGFGDDRTKRDDAKAECEYALSRELKARRYDEMQKEAP